MAAFGFDDLDWRPTSDGGATVSVTVEGVGAFAAGVVVVEQASDLRRLYVPVPDHATFRPRRSAFTSRRPAILQIRTWFWRLWNAAQWNRSGH